MMASWQSSSSTDMHRAYNMDLERDEGSMRVDGDRIRHTNDKAAAREE
jgi:hypothetical protein